jgi:hypothetical protein
MNPLWKAGMTPVNPAGRPKHSIRTASGMLERFIIRNISPQALKKLFGKLSPNEQANFLLQCLPYIMSKKSTESLSAEDIDALYEKVTEAMKNNTYEKKSQLIN